MGAEEGIEDHEAEERQAPGGAIIYGAIFKEGEEELKRPSSALFWSGLAAGLSMGFSLIAQGLLHHYLPESEWKPLVTKFGYSVGFLIVILGRQQLFTENTLTPVLPLLLHKRANIFFNVLRLWGIVLLANLLGALLIGWACVRTSAFDPAVRESFITIAREAVAPAFGTLLIRAIFAGWLIALMVWLLPFAEAARIWVIILLTYLIGIGHFSHIIAGAVEGFALAFAGEGKWGSILGGFLLPTLIGNMLGGLTLVAALNHAQVTSGKDREKSLGAAKNG